MQFIMNLFNVVKRLQKKSKAIHSIFNTVVTDLNKVNDMINVATAKKNADLIKIQNHILELKTELDNNTKVINKITSFLND